MENQPTVNDNLKVKIPFGKKIGYCFGGVTDTCAYDFVAVFLIFFMTDFAGIDPAMAGTIISLGVVWDVITDPIVGGLSDRIKPNKFGKKRSLLLVAMPLILVSYLLLFTNFDMGTGAKNAYFIVLSMAFWTGYTFFSVPYYSMGATMTMDNDERTKIRMLSMIIQYCGVFFSSVAPTMFVAWFLNAGMSDYNAWHYTGWIICIITVGTLLITFLTTGGLELEIQKEEKKKENFFKEAFEVLKIKPYLILVVMNLAYRIGYCFALTTSTYFFLYSVGLSPMGMSAANSILTFGGIIVIAAFMKLIEKVEKVNIFIIMNLIGGASLILANFLTIKSLGLLIVVLCFYLLGSAAYWSLNMPIMYDTVEIDEFQTGMRREGTMFSLYLCIQKVGYAIAASAIGQILANVGYDETLGANNPQNVLDAIQAMYCLGTGICLVIAAIIMFFYPLKRDTYEKLYAQLEKKRAGEEYNTEGFAHVLNKKYR